jgi:hypothetical protein
MPARHPRGVTGAFELRAVTPTKTDELARTAHSCPGETYFPPLLGQSPHAILESWVGEAELTGHADSYLGKRRWPRFTWDAIMLVRIRDGKLEGKILRVRARNVSLGGVGVVTRTPLPAGTSVEVMVEGRPGGLRGEVVHCTTCIQGHLVGISLPAPD